MEGANPPLLKGTGLSPWAILPSNPGLLQSGRVTSGGSGKGPWAGRRAALWGNRRPTASPQTPACSHHPHSGLIHLLLDPGRDLSVPSPSLRSLPVGTSCARPSNRPAFAEGTGLSCSGGSCFPRPGFPSLSTSLGLWVPDPIPVGLIPSVARPPSHRCTQRRHARTRARAALGG